MLTIKYKAVILNGVDKTGQVETLDDARAMTMVKLGHAELVSNVVNSDPEIVPDTGFFGLKKKR